jgi:HlyD family secretion protein
VKGKTPNLEIINETTKVVRGDIVQSITTTGELQPSKSVVVKAEASGRIKKLLFDVGQEVSEGETLLVLDQEDLKLQLASAKARLKQARARLEELKTHTPLPEEVELAKLRVKEAELQLEELKGKLKRREELAKKGFVTNEELDSLRLQVKRAEVSLETARTQLRKLENTPLPEEVAIAEAEVTMAEVEVKLKERQLVKSTVVAPVSGVVLDRFVEEGDTVVSALSSFSEGTRIATIANVKRMKFVGYVDESDISKVHLGEEIQFSLDAYPEKKFKGRITKISPKATSYQGQNIMVFKIEAIVENEENLLKPGMTAEGEIVYGTLKNVLLIPASSVRYEKGKTFVFIPSQNGLPKKKEVKLGYTNGEQAVVLEGLKEGDEILKYAPSKKLTMEELQQL